jgi:serine/threonine protein kinase
MELDLPVGQGSFGTIYRAIWNETPVAIKFLTSAKDKESYEPNNPGAGALVSVLESESQILASLRHPNIVQFIGVCSQPPCMVSEFVEKGSLSDLIRSTYDSQELSWGKLLKMLTDAATGMLYLHARSSPIIHCDLKSNNILVDNFYRTKICDFNLSRLLEQSTGSTLASVQNPRWIAPEVLDGEGYSKESDVYSFGIVMWEVLTRQIPWHGVDMGDIVSLVRDGARPQVPNFWEARDGRGNELIVFEEYADLMTSCWSQNPYDRPSFADIIKSLKDMTLLSSSDQNHVRDLGAKNHTMVEPDQALLTNESTRAMTDSMPYKNI